MDEVNRVADVKLCGLIFCLPQAKRFSGALLSESLTLPDTIAASPALEDGEIERNFISPHLRIADVPLAFHRESFSNQIAAPQPPTSPFTRRSIVTPQAGVNTSLSAHGELMDQLEAYGRILQYQFSDGKVLTGHQILYHGHSRLVPRHLLPLNVNVRNDLLAKAHYSLGIKRARASWASAAEQVIISALFSGLRALRSAEQEGEEFTLSFTLDDNSFRNRQALRLANVELREDKWNHWRLSTALPEAHSGVYYGRAHLELNTEDLGSFDGLSQGFHVDVSLRRLTFHTLAEQVNRLSTHILRPPPPPTEGDEASAKASKSMPKTNLLTNPGADDDEDPAALLVSDGESSDESSDSADAATDASLAASAKDLSEESESESDSDSETNSEPKAKLIFESSAAYKAPATFAEALAVRPPPSTEKSDAQLLRRGTATRSAIRASYIETAALEPHEAGGISLHLSGHGNIQTSIQEVNDLLKVDHKHLSVHPQSQSLDLEKVRPSMNLLGDGSFKFLTRFWLGDEEWEAHGFPQSMAYLLLNLQAGLAATTGLSINQIAHSRKGLKRERDTKILRHLGMAAMIFFEAASFGLGLPLSDGSVVKTERDLLDVLFARLGAVLLKGEGWPNQTGTLEGLCSKNVITLIEGFVAQILKDIEGREISLYLPSGEWKTTGITKSVVMIFHALVSDLAFESSGSCFTRARTKYFENFHFDRIHPDREDLALRKRMDPATSQRAIHQPIVSERFQAPESSVPPRGQSILNLLNRGFELSFDGKQIEEFVASDFRPEFQIHENSGMPSEITAGNGAVDGTSGEIGADGQPLQAAPPAPTELSPVVNLGAKKIDWFELHPKFFFKGVEITIEQAGKLSRDGMIEFQGKLFRVKQGELPSLKRLAQFWTSIQGHNAGLIRAKRRRTEETYYHLPRSQTLELLALRSTGVKVQGGPRWNAICEFYDSLDRNRTLDSMPESFRATLQGYQSQAVRWLLDLFELGLGGILADDMGLGKTVTSLAFLESLRVTDRLHAALVLVPTSLTYNWMSEAQRFTPDLPVHIYSSRQPEEMRDFLQKHDHGLVICTYGLLQENAEFFQQVPWNTVIFDEAQNLKNITTKRTTAARKLIANFKVCLTGTPLENHYGEFYSLFDLTVSGALGDLPTFREKYVNPERVLREDLDFLKLKIRPLLLRRTKAQVMHQLPPKVETTIKLPFEEEQRKIYRDIATSYNENIRQAIAQQGEAKSQLQMLTALLRLRQACSDPSAIPGVTYTGEPPKIVTLIEALIEVTESGESALVFTQFLATYERIRQAMAKAKITFYDMNGTDSRLAREKKLQGFKDTPGGAVMLMTLKTGGVGLNLTKASYIFHIEPWWNPAVENQATDRAHRMGQEKTVQVYRYLIQDSVEEKIEVLKEVKSRRFDALFSDSENEKDLETTSGALSQQDFEYLLG